MIPEFIHHVNLGTGLSGIGHHHIVKWTWVPDWTEVLDQCTKSASSERALLLDPVLTGSMTRIVWCGRLGVAIWSRG